MESINIQDVLKKLGIEKLNNGVSTGVDWFDTKGNITSSFSPIDG